MIGHISVQTLGTVRSEVEASRKKSSQLECPIRIAWKDQLTECVIQIRTIITAIKNSLGIHRGDDLADLDVIIIRRNRQARYEARLQDHAERPATRFLRRSEEHTSELQSLMRNSYDVFCLRKNKTNRRYDSHHS